jgi:hypothetical protein
MVSCIGNSVADSLSVSHAARYWVSGCQPASRVCRDRADRRRLLGPEGRHDRIYGAATTTVVNATAVNATAGSGRAAGDRRDRA